MGSLGSRPHPVKQRADSGERLYKYARLTKVSEDLDVTTTGSMSEAVMAPPEPEPPNIQVSWLKLCKQLRTKREKEMKKAEASCAAVRSLTALYDKGTVCLKQMAEKAEQSLNAAMDGWTLKIQEKKSDESQHEALTLLRDEIEQHAKTCKDAIHDVLAGVDAWLQTCQKTI